MKRVLKIPAQIAVVVIAGCAPAMTSGDASSDASARVDVAQSDGSTPRIDGGCYSGNRYLGQSSACYPTYPASECRAAFACSSSQCGEGCRQCDRRYRCILAGVDDGGLVADAGPTRCNSPAFTCDRLGCQPGCETFPEPVEGGGGVG